ncbi:MAG TPA: insulinase family protein [Kofleriaceae bacterium]|nr:insulinase family protein [Kofleriaceae bacterium]
MKTLSTLPRSLAAGLVAVAVACGPKAGPAVIPSLPGDGDTNVVKPDDDGKAPVANDPWTGRTDLIKAPPAQPPAAITLPPIERFTLPNGLQVVVVKSERLPVVSFQLMVKAGRADEPLARLGVAELTADLLPKGTKKKNALAIAKTIDLVGGVITADAGYEATWLTCAAMAKDAKVCLELLPEMLTQPSFPQDEIDKAKSVQLTEIARRLDDAGQLASTHAQNLLWGDDHVRGWVTSAAHIRQLAQSDLVTWHKTWFVPGNAVLAVSGDVDVAKLKKDLALKFGAWKKGPVPAHPKFGDAKARGTRVRLVDKPRQTQTQIRVAQYGIRHDDTRFFPTMVWNYALGGGAFSSRLMKVVRSEAGKTYGASSQFDRNADRGSFMITTFTRTAESAATLELVLGEIMKMQTQGPTQEEIDAAIANIAGSYAMRVSGADDLAAALVTADLHGLSQKYVSDFPVLAGQVSREEAAEAAASILTPRDMAIVLLGDGDAIAAQLDKAKIPFERVAFDKPIGPQPEAPAATAVDPKTAEAGKKLLEEALAAKGGEKIAKLKSLHMTAVGTLKAQGQTVDVEFERTLVLPASMLMNIKVAKQFEITFAVVGNGGWSKSPAGLDDIPSDQLPALAQQRWMDPELVLMRHREKDTTVALLKPTKIDGKAVEVVRLTRPDGMRAELYIDAATKLLVQSRYEAGGAQAIESFSDYKLVDGVQVAHKRVSQGGGEESNLTVTKVEFDPTIDAKIFAKPAK